MNAWKVTRPDGRDQWSGTIDYRAAIGGTVTAPDWKPTKECGHGIHTSGSVLDALSYARLPAAIFEVEALEPLVVIDRTKSKSQTVRVIREVTGEELDTLTGFRFREACDPIHPFRIDHGPVTDADLDLLRRWGSVWGSVRASVWASVGDSVRASVWDSVGDSVGGSVWDSVGDSVGGSVWDSVRASVWGSVWGSVWDSVRAYLGSLFPGVAKWRGVEHEPGVYPFQAAVDLWRSGLVPSNDGTIWRLHGGTGGRVVWEGTL